MTPCKWNVMRKFGNPKWTNLWVGTNVSDGHNAPIVVPCNVPLFFCHGWFFCVCKLNVHIYTHPHIQYVRRPMYLVYIYVYIVVSTSTYTPCVNLLFTNCLIVQPPRPTHIHKVKRLREYIHSCRYHYTTMCVPMCLCHWFIQGLMELTKELTERNWNDRTGQWDARQKCEYIKQNNTVEIRAISKHVSTTLTVLHCSVHVSVLFLLLFFCTFLINLF